MDPGVPTLTIADVEAAFRVAVAGWMLDRLDTRLGTADCARWIRSMLQCVGACSQCEDGDYPEWSRWVTQEKKGFLVTVKHHLPEGVEEVVREGLVVWNRLANMATIRACERQREQHRAAAEPLPGEQLVLSV